MKTYINRAIFDLARRVSNRDVGLTSHKISRTRFGGRGRVVVFERFMNGISRSQRRTQEQRIVRNILETNEKTPVSKGFNQTEQDTKTQDTVNRNRQQSRKVNFDDREPSTELGKPHPRRRCKAPQKRMHSFCVQRSQTYIRDVSGLPKKKTIAHEG